MRTRRTSDAAWSEAAARRLAQLTADLGGGPGVAAAEQPGPSAAVPQPPRPLEPTRPPGSRAAAGAPAPAEWPRPGRHASRRRRVSRWRLPELGAAHLAVVAVLAAAGLGVTTWMVARDQPVPVTPVPAAEASPLVDGLSAGGASPSASGAAAAAEEEVTVDVTGKVRRPGIVVLDAGARVVDALEAAGGARPRVDLTSLNLARVLVDGEQIVVGPPAAAVPVVPPGSASVPGAPTQPVNLNLATLAELETLPEVGPVTAQAIVAWRDRTGGFTSVDELLEVDGIGEKTLALLTPLVTV